MPTPFSADDVQKDLVHVRFVEFTDTNFRGTEQAEGMHKDGYLIYNDNRKDFGFGTFRTSDDYTLEYDVMDYIHQKHPDFVPYIQQGKGFYIGGTWYAIDERGAVIKQ